MPIGGLVPDVQAKVIVRTINELAHALNLTTTAEGVETQAQWDALRSLGCDQAQGYWLAKPMPAGAVDPFILNWRARASRTGEHPGVFPVGT